MDLALYTISYHLSLVIYKSLIWSSIFLQELSTPPTLQIILSDFSMHMKSSKYKLHIFLKLWAPATCICKLLYILAETSWSSKVSMSSGLPSFHYGSS